MDRCRIINSTELPKMTLTVLLIAGLWCSPLYSGSRDTNPSIQIKNITSSHDYLEIKPRFMDDDKSVLYLVFDGDPLKPKPWDYKLVKLDRENGAKEPLTTLGVLDYNVLPDERGVLVLKADPSLELTDMQAQDYYDVRGWELWYINTLSNEKVLLEASPELPLSMGYLMLGLGVFPDFSSDEYVISSPNKSSKIVVKRIYDQDPLKFSFSHVRSEGEARQILTTDGWKSYNHDVWLPTITWLDESTFFTVRFTEKRNKKYPYLDGYFSILRIDLENDTQEVWFEDALLKPFPKLVINPITQDLYFQMSSSDENRTQLWKINLFSKIREKIYEVEGDLGEVRFSLDGNSLVLTQLQNNNFDIICLDLPHTSMTAVADK